MIRLRSFLLNLLEPALDVRFVHVLRLAQLVAILAAGVCAHVGLYGLAMVLMSGAVLVQLMIMERQRL